MSYAISKSTQSLTTAEDTRALTKIIMQPFANWEEYLTPAPLSIAILGELVFISSSTDFSINKNPPKDGYKFIKYPDSFRACLMQVCNSGWWAFNEAHTSMDQIRLHTAQVPDYMKTAVKILFQDKDEVVKAHLPDQLDNIRVIADECLKLSDATEKRFTEVIKIVQELEKIAIEQIIAQLNSKRQTYEKCVENLENNQKELTEILVTMRNWELEEIDFKTTIEMLIKGMDAMGRVKEQWEKMVHFFQMVSNIVKTSLSKTLTNFVSTSEKIQALSYDGKLFSKDLLYFQAFQISNITCLVHMISATYTDVSSKYLMDRVSSLGKLMAMNKSKPEFEHERKLLQNGCDEAQKGILNLVLKNKLEFDRKSTARLERIDRELLAILPAPSPEEIKRIQEDVQTGFSKEEESYY
uniref:Uncharacterized protein n=1 Tax=Cyprinus carpio TaxID=7962 RepID=A0A8C2C3V2_CYPCA